MAPMAITLFDIFCLSNFFIMGRWTNKMPSQMDVAPWYYKWDGWMFGSTGFRAPYSARKPAPLGQTKLF